jgi:hypothetical protein
MKGYQSVTGVSLFLMALLSGLLRSLAQDRPAVVNAIWDGVRNASTAWKGCEMRAATYTRNSAIKQISYKVESVDLILVGGKRPAAICGIVNSVGKRFEPKIGVQCPRNYYQRYTGGLAGVCVDTKLLNLINSNEINVQIDATSKADAISFTNSTGSKYIVNGFNPDHDILILSPGYKVISIEGASSTAITMPDGTSVTVRLINKAQIESRIRVAN